MEIHARIEVPAWLKELLAVEDNGPAWSAVNEMVANASNPLVVFGVETKSSQRWAEITGVVVYDPDGWNRLNYQYSWFDELITFAEFKRRVFMSTVDLNSIKALEPYRG